MPTRCGAIQPRTSISTFSRNTARHITSVDHGVTATRSDLIERVSTLELFFDVVFVFTITQLTRRAGLELIRLGPNGRPRPGQRQTPGTCAVVTAWAICTCE